MGIDEPHTNSSLGVQLQWFKDLMARTTKSPAEVRAKLASALVMVGEIGGNDYNFAFAVHRPDGGNFLFNLGSMTIGAGVSTALVPAVVKNVIGAARELLEMGATRVVIPGNFPLGCVPGYLRSVDVETKLAYDANGCLVVLNLWAQLHNELLQQGIRGLRASYPAAKISYADYFDAYVQLKHNAAQMGFDPSVSTKPCCGAGAGAYNFDVDRMCGAPGTTVCARPSEYLSWDGIQLTQHAYRALTDLLYHQGLASPPPVNFPRHIDGKELIERHGTSFMMVFHFFSENSKLTKENIELKKQLRLIYEQVVGMDHAHRSFLTLHHSIEICEARGAAEATKYQV